MNILERLTALCKQRFGDAYTIAANDNGGFIVRLSVPENRTGARGIVYPIEVAAGVSRVRSEDGADPNAPDEVTFSFSSEYPVANWAGQPEILSHHKDDCDLTRLSQVGAILRNHNAGQISGVPVRVWIDEASRKGMCVEKFGTTEIAEQTKHEVLIDKTLRGISVGFMVREWVYLEGEGTRYRNFSGTKEGLWIASKWQALEASHTPIPADPSVGVGRSIAGSTRKLEGDGMKKFKLSREWNGHKAGEIVEATEAQAREIVDGKLGEEHTEQREAQKPATAPVTEPTRAQPADPQAFVVAERERCKAIRAIGAKHGVDVTAFIDGGNSLEDVRAAVLDVVAERQSNQATGRVQVTKDGITSFRAAVANGLRLAMGRTLTAEERKVGGEDMRGMTLIELAKECDRRKGLPVEHDADAVIDRALHGPRLSARDLRHAEEVNTSTSDFPYILANVANKEMLAGAASVRVTWPQWAKRGSISDFKAASRLKLSEAGDLALVLEGAGYGTTKFSEQRETLTLGTYGTTWAMTRQMMINDDKAAFTDVPFALGRRAAYKPEILAVVQLLGNGNMADGNALFSTAHGNLSEVAGNAPGTSVAQARTCLQALWLKMQTQKAMQHADLAAEVALYSGADLKTVLCGPTGWINLASALNPAMSVTSGSEVSQALAGLGITLVSSPLLENALVTGYSTTAVYGFADPALSPVIEVAFLNGQDMPYQEEVENTGSAADGRLFKVRLDVVAGKVDYRGAVKEKGA